VRALRNAGWPPAFQGDTTADALAGILERDPDWSALPPATPQGIRRLLQRLPRERSRAPPSRHRRRERRPRRRERGDSGGGADRRAPALRLPPSALAIAAIVFAVAGTVWRLWVRPSPVRPRPAQFTFAPPEGERLEIVADSSRPIPSPDGSRIAFIATSASGTSALWIRRVDSVAAHRLAGTEDIVGPAFWSPDGRFLGFFAQGKLKKSIRRAGPR
jgi:serine/threonine-protein kinase